MQPATTGRQLGDPSGPSLYVQGNELNPHERKKLLERRRENAREVVRKAGLPLWRKLVNDALSMLSAGMRPEHAAKMLTRCTKRLPGGEASPVSAASENAAAA